MHETEPKITLLVVVLYKHRGIQNLARHLKWSRKKRLAKNNYAMELLQKDITIRLTGCK